jgi:hypothetical protein
VAVAIWQWQYGSGSSGNRWQWQQVAVATGGSGNRWQWQQVATVWHSVAVIAVKSVTAEKVAVAEHGSQPQCGNGSGSMAVAVVTQWQ